MPNRKGVRRSGALSERERNFRRKQTQVRRATGKPTMVPDDQSRQHLKWLMEYMPLAEVAHRAGLPLGTVATHAYGRTAKLILLETLDALLDVRPEPGELTYTERSRGVSRMISGLIARGYTTQAISRLVGRSHNTISRYQKTWKPVTQEFYNELLCVAAKLEQDDPANHCVPSQVKSMITQARNRRLVPLGAWDLETIHRDDAAPELTGYCGTAQGHRYHYRHRIPVCANCAQARQIYRRFPQLAYLMGISKERE